MTDVHSSGIRSFNMSRIQSKDTKPEIFVRSFLFSKGFRFRKNVKSLPGSPDVVLRKYGVVIFINGCFWHGHDCKKAKLPKSRTDFWRCKILKNKERDNKSKDLLNKANWKVIVLWQCEISNKVNRNERLNRLVKEIKYRGTSR